MGQGLSTEVGDRALYYENLRELEALEHRLLSGTEVVEVVDISNKYLGLEGAVRAADVLQANSTLRELNLSYNRLTDESLGVLCAALAKNNTLEVLNLSGNSLTSEGVSFLASLLQGSKLMHTLSLYNCKLTDESIVPLVNGIAQNESLYSLNISMNEVTDRGAAAVLQCLGYNKSLASIDLRLNEMSAAKQNAIQEALSQHKQDQAALAQARRERLEAELKRREAEADAKQQAEEKRRDNVQQLEQQRTDMEVRERELREEETAMQEQQLVENQARRVAQESARSRKKEYIETAVSNAYTWRAKLLPNVARAWESGFTVKPVSSTGDPNADTYGMVRTLQPCWCEPTDAPAGYAGQLHYHCKYEQEPDTFHTGDDDHRKYEGCKRTGHACISVGVYAKPLQKDTAATFFSSRSPNLTET